MTDIFESLALALLVFCFALIMFLNNPYRIYFAEKAINKAIKEQRQQERDEKRRQKKLEQESEKNAQEKKNKE